MTLYIQSKDVFEDLEEDSLFAMKMNEEDFESIGEQLFEKGFVHFRWGGFPPCLENPEEELNIVDDCYPFILTNIHGPISRENDELSLMDDDHLRR